MMMNAHTTHTRRSSKRQLSGARGTARGAAAQAVSSESAVKPLTAQPQPAWDHVEPRVRVLARAFSREPELILAWLEAVAAGGESEPDDTTPTHAEILEAARAALKLQPGYADLHRFAAHAAVAAGEPATAAAWLDRALELNPWYRDALIFRAKVALSRGLAADAIRSLETAVQIGADYPDVQAMLREARRSCGAGNTARLQIAAAVRNSSSPDEAANGPFAQPGKGSKR